MSELRHSRGWSQEQLAERLRVDARTLPRIEAGRHITFAMLVHLADAFRVPIAALFEPPASRSAPRPGRPRRASPAGTHLMAAEPGATYGTKTSMRDKLPRR